ncbi:M15 family metallopeptidase [Paenibacillus sp. IB182496]|uniref:M15 family metallopeptidase n=1 Tax=Paenibacillus sabuli TaxID=2772509 RepID=A0A927GU93_9BACL|nr:M15 family metallopeptidase [Paenibacillus sabuli]MBD2848433.1 M15 family metallopeptidase [Paenibacillus sabuli]
MKKWIVGFLALALLGFGVARCEMNSGRELDDGGRTEVLSNAPHTPEAGAQPGDRKVSDPVGDTDTAAASGTSADARGDARAVGEGEGMDTLRLEERDIYKGELLLVNEEIAISPDFEAPETLLLYEHRELVQGFGLMDRSIRLTPELLERFTAMVEEAETDGVDRFLITSGYRTEEEQGELYRQLGAESAMPAGYSEHNLGMALDIGSSIGEMRVAPEGEWLREYAWEHGFILRYPEDKTEVTGVKYEPWHYRYVGLPHSAVMQQKGWVLEEYLAFLKEHRAMEAEWDGQRYHIAYYPLSETRSIRVPADGRYTVSGNNTDGVVVTVWE